jgi:hypothetical protein
MDRHLKNDHCSSLFNINDTHQDTHQEIVNKYDFLDKNNQHQLVKINEINSGINRNKQKLTTNHSIIKKSSDHPINKHWGVINPSKTNFYKKFKKPLHNRPVRLKKSKQQKVDDDEDEEKQKVIDTTLTESRLDNQSSPSMSIVTKIVGNLRFVCQPKQFKCIECDHSDLTDHFK